MSLTVWKDEPTDLFAETDLVLTTVLHKLSNVTNTCAIFLNTMVHVFVRLESLCITVVRKIPPYFSPHPKRGTQTSLLYSTVKATTCAHAKVYVYACTLEI